MDKTKANDAQVWLLNHNCADWVLNDRNSMVSRAEWIYTSDAMQKFTAPLHAEITRLKAESLKYQVKWEAQIFREKLVNGNQLKVSKAKLLAENKALKSLLQDVYARIKDEVLLLNQNK